MQTLLLASLLVALAGWHCEWRERRTCEGALRCLARWIAVRHPEDARLMSRASLNDPTRYP